MLLTQNAQQSIYRSQSKFFSGVWLYLEGNLKDNKVKIKSSGAGDNSHRQLCS